MTTDRALYCGWQEGGACLLGAPGMCAFCDARFYLLHRERWTGGAAALAAYARWHVEQAEDAITKQLCIGCRDGVPLVRDVTTSEHNGTVYAYWRHGRNWGCNASPVYELRWQRDHKEE